MKVNISVITICFNNPEELATTCASVDRQLTLPFEHWIIDGSTNDNIRKFLSNTPQPSYRKWISERDSGISDAFNKGIKRASGEVVNMLNSGDHYFNENTLSIVEEAFIKEPAIAWLHSKYVLQRGGKWVTIGKPFNKKKLYRGMRSLAHQSMFVKKELHNKYGLYDTSLTIAMDYDFVCRIAEEPFAFLEECLIVFAPGGVSQLNYFKSLKQAKIVYKQYFGASFKLTLWQVRLQLLHIVLNSPLGKFLYRIKVLFKLENV
ncbi:MAG: glycosyltransferase [Chitinophagaceae bacterium]|nr:glycosyltransferase [Chitinophagaceae bacterium]